MFLLKKVLKQLLKTICQNKTNFRFKADMQKHICFFVLKSRFLVKIYKGDFVISNLEVRGYNVKNFKNKEVGVVGECVWKGNTSKVDGFIIYKNKFVQVKYYLPYSSIDKIENSNIYLIKNYKTRNNKLEIFEPTVSLNGSTAYVSKYFFDEKNGCVESVEIAKSIYEDLKCGRKVYKRFTAKKGQIIIEDGE